MALLRKIPERERGEAGKRRMKILVAGAGKLGLTVTTRLLLEGHDLTIIDSSQAALDATENLDVIGRVGNCVTNDTLYAAGVQDADLLIAVTGSDEVNLLSCVTAHAINRDLRTIARVRNPAYAEQIASMKDLFGVEFIVNPEQKAASEIGRLLQYPAFLKRDCFAKGRTEIVELKVEAGSPLRDLSLRDLSGVAGCKVLICAVQRGEKTVIPSGDFVLREGDSIFVTASSDNLNALLKNLGILTHPAKRVMLAGGSNISIYLARELERKGVSVTLIERNKELCEKLANMLDSASVINGDVSSRELLESEGLASCDAMVALTGLDELNMVLSLYARSFGVPKIITKLGRVEDQKVIDSLPLGSVISPRKISCDDIVRVVRALQNSKGAAVGIHFIADGAAEAGEFLLDESCDHCGEPLKALRLKRNVLIASITRGTRTEIPGGDSSFREGDTVVVVSCGGGIRQFNDIFERE